jgi:hypothetical protein
MNGPDCRLGFLADGCIRTILNPELIDPGGLHIVLPINDIDRWGHGEINHQ